MNAKYPAAPLGLVTVAAMLPSEWKVKLVDCNVQDLTDTEISWADIVLSGGMISQQREHLALVEMLCNRKKVHVVGGPDATSSPGLYDQATHLVLGEAEVCLPQFLQDFGGGNALHIYAAGEKKANVTLSPIPRFELLKFSNYLHVGIQFARGCPFNCEFCDIIELFGRVPRMKSEGQLLSELDRLYELGYRGHVDLVDDNFIGNKHAVKKLLPRLKEWQVHHRFPFEFTTEATINLSDDVELMTMMEEVGFFAIFVGIESPDEATLKQTQKGQNTKRSIPKSIHRIYQHGMVVNAGYIVGFDSEQGSVARGIIQSIIDTAIPVNMVGLLFALPNTQLARRLSKEKRLIPDFQVAPDNAGDQCLGGINFETLRPKREIFADYQAVLRESYSPEAYFARVLQVALELNCSKKKLRIPIRNHVRDLRGFFKLIILLGIIPSFRFHFWKILLICLIKNQRALRYAVGLMALYLHFGPFKDFVVQTLMLEIDKCENKAPSPRTSTPDIQSPWEFPPLDPLPIALAGSEPIPAPPF